MKATKRLCKALCIGAMACMVASCGHDYSKELARLRTELQATGDTVLAWSMKNHYALWIHTDRPHTEPEGPSNAVYSLYYYDLKAGSKEKLFTTRKDSLTWVGGADWEKKHVVDTYFRLHFSPDSCALVVEDGTYVTSNCIYLYPLMEGDRKTAYLLSYGNVEDVSDEPNRYKAKAYVPLLYDREALSLQGADINWPPSTAWREITYDTSGKVVEEGESYYVNIGSYAGREYKPVEISPYEISRPEELAAALISYSAYDMGDVYSLSHNAVQFDHAFGNGLKEQFFSLYVEQLQTLDTPDGTVLCLVGDGFVAYSTDWRFADLSYPAGLTAKGLLKYADDGSGWDFVFWNLTLVDMPG